MDGESLGGGTARRILVVDDDARVRRALRVLIDSADGLAVAGEASSSAEAIRADAEVAPDVVLLDLMLPAPEDGLKALAALVAGGRGVVVLSLRGELRAAALEGGALCFVEKAAGPDVLLEALRGSPRRTSEVS